ncbi:MAG: hypothetical protein IJS32_06770, partial [Kiritimatiellae bacterium]|nr:hypothetical protein [Kiritimatiellia bacterium]
SLALKSILSPPYSVASLETTRRTRPNLENSRRSWTQKYRSLVASTAMARGRRPVALAGSETRVSLEDFVAAVKAEQESR